MRARPLSHPITRKGLKSPSAATSDKKEPLCSPSPVPPKPTFFRHRADPLILPPFPFLPLPQWSSGSGKEEGGDGDQRPSFIEKKGRETVALALWVLHSNTLFSALKRLPLFLLFESLQRSRAKVSSLFIAPIFPNVFDFFEQNTCHFFQCPFVSAFLFADVLELYFSLSVNAAPRTNFALVPCANRPFLVNEFCPRSRRRRGGDEGKSTIFSPKRNQTVKLWQPRILQDNRRVCLRLREGE